MPLPHETLFICPGLRAGPDGLHWTDSLGRVHDLVKCQRTSVGGAAILLQRSIRSVLRKIESKQLYPVVRHSERDIEVYLCGVEDYLVRKTADVAR